MESTDFHKIRHGNAYMTRLKHGEEKNIAVAVLSIGFEFFFVID